MRRSQHCAFVAPGIYGERACCRNRQGKRPFTGYAATIRTGLPWRNGRVGPKSVVREINKSKAHFRVVFELSSGRIIDRKG